MGTYEMIKQAILQKQQVIANYKGHIRHMCPHAIGTKYGHEQALFYQFGGTSSSGLVTPTGANNWRCIPIAGLSGVSVRNGAWYTAQNHSTAQTCIDIVDAEVSL